MITVPQGFVLIEQGPLTLVLHQQYREQLLGCGLGDPERLCAQQTGVMHAGRGAMPVIELECFIRAYCCQEVPAGRTASFSECRYVSWPSAPV